MPGMLSNVFGSQDGGQSADGTTTTQSMDASEVGGHLEIDPTVSLHSEMSGTYQDLEGDTHSWSHEGDLTVSLDVTGTLALATESLDYDTNA